MGGSSLDDEQMDRRQRVQATADPDRYFYAYTPEDILLQKLHWLGLSDLLGRAETAVRRV